MADFHDKLVSLIKLVSEKTEARELKWEQYDESSIIAPVEKFYVSISEKYVRRNNSQQKDILFRVHDENKVVIEEVSDVALSGKITPGFSTMSWFAYLDGIRTSAKRQISGVDRIIDNLISSLS